PVSFWNSQVWKRCLSRDFESWKEAIHWCLGTTVKAFEGGTIYTSARIRQVNSSASGFLLGLRQLMAHFRMSRTGSSSTGASNLRSCDLRAENVLVPSRHGTS